MERHSILLCALFACVFYLHTTVTSNEISAKLDFNVADSTSKPQKSSKNTAKIDVDCSSGSCNKTTTKKDDGIETDITIQIKTNVNAASSKSSNKTKVDVADVPIIIGTDSSSSSRSFGSSSIGSPAINRDYPELRRVGNAFVPSTYYFQPQPPKRRPSPAQRRSHTPPHDQVSDSDVIYVPYFEPSFHVHNFGESLPPQYVWRPSGSIGRNPHEFKRLPSPPAWNSAHWTNRLDTVSRTRPSQVPGHVIVCEYPIRGSGWQPRLALDYHNGNVGIDDKLGALN